MYKLRYYKQIYCRLKIGGGGGVKKIEQMKPKLYKAGNRKTKDHLEL